MKKKSLLLFDQQTSGLVCTANKFAYLLVDLMLQFVDEQERQTDLCLIRELHYIIEDAFMSADGNQIFKSMEKAIQR